MIDISSQRWVLNKFVAIDVGMIADNLDDETKMGFLRTLRFYAENYSADHTRNCARLFHNIIKFVGDSKISVEGLISFRSTLGRDEEYKLGAVRGFLKQWSSLGNPGVTDEVAALLKGWRLRGNRKGEAVKKLDVNLGPLSDIELQALVEGLFQGYETGVVCLSDLAMSLLECRSGRRPVQLTHLKILDIDSNDETSGGTRLIQIPRAKQRETEFRSSFSRFPISMDLLKVLVAQAGAAEKMFETVLKRRLCPEERKLVPLFPDRKLVRSYSESPTFRSDLAGDWFHQQSGNVTSTLKRVVRQLDVRSERTGERLNINATRLRYTIGTRAAREGYGEQVIAELLDHSDIQNVGVYVKNIPEHLDAIDAAVGHELAMYARAFAGILVDRESEAQRGDDLASRVRHNGCGVGTCASYAHCSAAVPVPCYTCIHFQPWLEGPHLEVLTNLLSERQRVLSATNDKTIAAINDRTIAAVAEVVQRCEVRKNEVDASG